MNKLKRMSIAMKISITIVFVVVLQTGVLFYKVSNELRQDFLSEIKRDAQVTLVSLQQTLEFLATKNEIYQQQKTVAALGSNLHIKNALFLDEKNKVIASTQVSAIGKSFEELLPAADNDYLIKQLARTKSVLRNLLWQSKDETSFYAVSPISLGRMSSQSLRPDKVGAMYIHFDLNLINQQANQKFWTDFAYLILVLSISGVGLWFYFHVSINQRIKLLSEASARFPETDFKQRLKITGNDEISDLAQAFNAMAMQVKEQQKELLKRERNLSITLNSIADAVITTDAEGRITGMNTMAEQQTGWSQDEAVGLSVNSVFVIVDSITREPIENPVEKMLTSGQPVVRENDTRLLSKNGDEYVIRDSAAAIRNEDGCIIRLILVFTDITESKQYEADLKETNILLENVLNSTPDLIFVKNTKLQTVLANRAFAGAVGKTPEELLGHTDIENGWGPELAQGDPAKRIRGFDCDDRDALAGLVVHNPHDSANIEGEIRIFDTHKLPLRDANGAVIGVLGVARDITEQRQAVEKLKHQQKQQQQILDTMVDGVITIDETGVIHTFNKAAEKLFGYRADEVIGQNVTQLLPTFITEQLENYWENGIGDALRIGREVEGKHKNNRIFPMRLSVAELPQGSYDTRRFIGSCQDLTQLKQQEEQLRRSQKMDALGKLTGGIAHDFNNLLAMILGYSELLAKQFHDQPKFAKYIDQITRAGERGVKLTRKLLSFSRQQPAQEEVVNINQLLAADEDMLRKTLTARVDLKLNLQSSLWGVNLDSNSFEDMLLNMSINAMHAMPNGGQLTLTTNNETLSDLEAARLNLQAGDYISLCIEDTGCGMSEEVKEKIFDPFFTTKKEKGTGLGLSQVYGFLHSSGGGINVNSELNVGTRFVIYLPRAIEAVEHKTILGERLPESYVGSETILVVDDEIALSELAEEILTNNGYRVLIASSGERALELLATHKVDVVVTDIVMPQMDGYQLAKKIRHLYPEILVLFASGFRGEHDNKKLDASSADLFISKPYKPQVLLANIRQLLDQ